MGRASNRKWTNRRKAFALAKTVTERLRFFRFGHHPKFWRKAGRDAR